MKVLPCQRTGTCCQAVHQSHGLVTWPPRICSRIAWVSQFSGVTCRVIAQPGAFCLRGLVLSSRNQADPSSKISPERQHPRGGRARPLAFPVVHSPCSLTALPMFLGCVIISWLGSLGYVTLESGGLQRGCLGQEVRHSSSAVRPVRELGARQ